MRIDIKKTMDLRNKTGLSVMLCKKALEQSDGDEAGAMKWLQEQGVFFAGKKASRGTRVGIVESYIHANGQVGVLLELKCETDFVARNLAFREFAHNIAMHIAASNSADVQELLGQPFIKNLDLNVSQYLAEAIQKFGENIEISRFERFAL